MASKEATVFVLDLGATMGSTNESRNEIDLDWGMRYVWDKITTIMSASRSTLSVGVLGFRTDETLNALADSSEEYENIVVLKPLGQMTMAALKDLQTKIHPNGTDKGDAVSAIVVAERMINEFTQLKSGKPGKFRRKIIVLTDGKGDIADDGNEEIAKQLNESDIDLVVIGIDFDDLGFGYKEEDKTEHKRRNEAILKELTDNCNNGIFATAAEAIDQLSIPETKQTKPYSTYKGNLCLGDPGAYPDTAIVIEVERYFRTHAQAAPSASSFAVNDQRNTNRPGSQQSSNTLQGDTEMTDAPNGDSGLISVHNERNYYIDNPDADKGREDVSREDLAKGYMYGRTAVPLAESDENVTKLETTQGFDILGFIPWDKYERFLNLGESGVTHASPMNDKARMAFSSLVHALYELDSYAVARLVKGTNKEPQMLLLCPSIEPGKECLIDVPLPFAEDVRTYRFAPLDRIVTTSGTTIRTGHRYLPSDDLQQAMDTYVDGMDLSTFGRDDDGNPTEYMTIEETFNPTIHRINAAIKRRAVAPDEEVAPPSSAILKFSHPPQALLDANTTQLSHLITAAKITKVPPKAQGGRRRREPIIPLSGLNVEALLSGSSPRTISAENAIPEFRQFLDSSEKIEEAIPVAVKQMGDIIRGIVAKSRGFEGKYLQALADLAVMREAMVDVQGSAEFNAWMRGFKEWLLREGSEHEEFFHLLVRKKVGLIGAEEAEAIGHGVSEEEVAEFWRGNGLPLRGRA